MSLNCPMCGGRSVGQIGIEQYYCRDCFVEYNSKNEVFEISDDGSLTACNGSAKV